MAPPPLARYTAAVTIHPCKLLLILFPLLLTGCFQTQLLGTVGGSEITVAPLDQPDRVLETHRATHVSQYIAWKGQERWDKWSRAAQLALIGIFRPTPDLLSADTYYLITIRGGINRDPDMRGNFHDEGRPVRGPWHAILPPASVGDFRNKASLLTEASYQWYRMHRSSPGASSPDIAQLLDDSAARLVGDVDENGKIEYRDVLIWNVYEHRALFTGDEEALRHLDVALSAGFPEQEIQRLVRKMMGEETAPPQRSFLDFMRWRLGIEPG